MSAFFIPRIPWGLASISNERVAKVVQEVATTNAVLMGGKEARGKKVKMKALKMVPDQKT